MPLGLESGFRLGMPPGYLGFSSPPGFQRSPIRGDPLGPFAGGLFRRLSGDPSENAGRNWAADRRAVLCRQRRARISEIVTSLPLGTLRITSSTSLGAGTTIVRSPQCRVIFPSIAPTFGRPFLSASFSRHVFFLAAMRCTFISGREFSQEWVVPRNNNPSCRPLSFQREPYRFHATKYSDGLPHISNRPRPQVRAGPES